MKLRKRIILNEKLSIYYYKIKQSIKLNNNQKNYVKFLGMQKCVLKF